MILMNAKKFLSYITVMCVVISIGMLVGCKSNDSADLVVYGKIFTSEGGQIVEAFAVKDGKYIYVGDKAGAEAYIEEGKTEVVDYTGKGLVMPGCGNAHAHYSLGYAIQSAGTVMDRADGVDKFIKEIVPAAVKKAKDNKANVVFGSGWDMMKFPKDLCYRKLLDEVCSDIPIYFADEEGHKGLANTILLKKAGLIKEDGSAGKTEVRGGEVVLDADGIPTGYVKEQAGTYVRSFLDNEYLFSVDVAKANMAGIRSSCSRRAIRCIRTATPPISSMITSTRLPSRWTRLATCTLCWVPHGNWTAGWMWIRPWKRLLPRRNTRLRTSRPIGSRCLWTARWRAVPDL